jgi:hypothetical protein
VIRKSPDPVSDAVKIPEPLTPPALRLTAKLNVSACASKDEAASVATMANWRKQMEVMGSGPFREDKIPAGKVSESSAT